MASVTEKKNFNALKSKAVKINRKGKVYKGISLFFMIVLGVDIIATPFMGKLSELWTSAIIMLVMFALFYLLFKHGKKLQVKAAEFVKEAMEAKNKIDSEELPSLAYGDGKTVHTHFVLDLPFYIDVNIDGKLLKIKAERMTQRNVETSINLADVSNIKFKEASLTPGYIGFETPAHSISNADFKTDSNTIPFANDDSKQYILELKEYTEFLMNTK